MSCVDWQNADNELNNAFRARDDGNEGKARVCARRAAGKAFVAAGLTTSPTLAGIRESVTRTDMPAEILKICANMMVIVDEDHELDAGIDLLEDVTRLFALLHAEIRSSRTG